MERIERLGESVILYDDSIVNQMRECWFERAFWPAAPAAPGYSGGRGVTLFLRCEEQDWVLRHYHRGGAAATVATDTFFWLGENRTRSFREWRLLRDIVQAGLPAPRPVAARYVRCGLLYRADLMTVRIPGVVPFSVRMASGPLDLAMWREVGACVARFHRAGFFHADLNAHNLQIGAHDEIFLLDFDRGCRMARPGAWQRRNIERLHRSLRKVSRDDAAMFSDAAWEALLRGYRELLPASVVPG